MEWFMVLEWSLELFKQDLYQYYPPKFIIVFFIDCIIVLLPYMSSSTNSSNNSTKTTDFRTKYKTEKCRYWYERGFCPFNQFCAFAHCDEELRDKQLLNNQYKTKSCLNFKKYGYCKYGDRCQFLHLVDLPQPSDTQDDFPSLPSSSLSEIHQNDIDQKTEKHQKQLMKLSQFGLEVLNLSKNRSDRWRAFLNGVALMTNFETRFENFEEEFPDYDFSKKPRLGSI